MIVTKVDVGIYWLHHKGRAFEISKSQSGWMVYEMKGQRDAHGIMRHDRRQHCGDHSTKRGAIAMTLEGFGE